jgi:hypothetical protein
MKPGRVADLAVACATSALLGTAALLRVQGSSVVLPGGHALPSLCWWRDVFGPCPFCGLTRSFVALFDGDLASGFGWNPAGPLLLVFLGCLSAAILIAAASRRDAILPRRGFARALHGVAAASLAVGVVRLLWS